ncbi:glutaryl-7-ACA acylase [Steroidobacter agaridevorans]|uniref:Glutaryl-7-ACA acylase n=1 Tax=Steroidobacter agaridevorans TaxID=2695856 RepID=A0A829YCD8_9GAMM|nr:CocE/NonD family hydrolase [Steroidobacter agaridevorans]GFE80316.1 glutaryl-7-ACA acylase [Steroidobacter agaridevorans]GFE87369.1 glutaryl-7-ACA acylase [Steroidobacter agaridevorans]
MRIASQGWLLVAILLIGGAASADQPNLTTANYERRVFDIPMRDGVKLHTVIVIPKGAKDAPILLTRTPYNAEWMTRQKESNDMRVLLEGFDNAADVIVEGGYIRVVQDIRGKHGSGGDFVVTRPLAGSPFNRTSVDEATDGYDTIDWLVKHVAEANDKVGIIGTSYNGFTALMALVNPHPALEVAVPMDPMVDGWRGDDWFHNGAFRQYAIAAIHGSESRDNSAEFPWNSADRYETFMRAGSVGELARRHGTDKVQFWRHIVEHPAYDEFWQSQALDRILADRPLQVPVMIVGSLWDQEDIYGATAVYKALEPRDRTGKQVYLTLGPWHHAQSIFDGSSVGKIRWGHDTAKWWRQQVLAPFLAHHLKGAPMDVAPVTAFESGSNEWRRLAQWPVAPANAKLYLKPNGELGFDAPAGPLQTADYISDPANPVTFVPRPMRVDDNGDQWESWLTADQRTIAARPDVLTFTSKVLDKAVSIAGEPMVKLMASTSGTDSDWVVKLIDVYPDRVADDTTMSGYQLPVAMEIFRGRYRKSLSRAEPLESDVPLRFEFALPNAHHVFRPGHRIMVQVQSSWFPLYDRNPQTFVPNIFFARPGEYVKATQQVVVAGPDASHIELPIRH